MVKKKELKETVTVLIPAYNEEKNIRKIVKDSLAINGLKTEVLVLLDSKTTDDTEKEAIKAGGKVIKIKKSIGKGTNIKSSLPYIHGDFVVQIDADYQFLPKEIPLLIKPLKDGYDITLGTRYEKGAHIEKGSVSTLKLLGSYFLSAVTTIVIRQRITDVMAGFKAFKTPVLKKLKPTTDHFGYEAELVIKGAKKGYKIKNVPISYKKRVVGSSNVKSIQHGLLVLRTILKQA